uniref:Uncharacterized protein n=1 Tax=Knipowitschia caucasica TaxID=637954 RepID=A0AAV2LER1_KNICA
MSQLHPLLAVVDQYRVDVQSLGALRWELQNLSLLLTSIQEEVGAYDYEELQQRVLLLESRLHGCMNKLGQSLSSPLFYLGSASFSLSSELTTAHYSLFGQSYR